MEGSILVFVDNIFRKKKNIITVWPTEGFFSHGKFMDTLFPVFSRSGREGNFGFRRFLDRHATMKAVDALNRSSIRGRRLIVKL